MKNQILIVFLFLFTIKSICQVTIDFTNFSNANLNGWTLVNGSETNQWKIGGADSYFDVFSRVSAYISSDNGTTHTYNNSTSSIAYMYKDFAVNNVTHDMLLTFKLKCEGEASADYASIYQIPTSITPQAGVEIDNQYKIGKSEYSGSDYWRGYKIGIDRNNVTENFMRLAIAWKNDDNGIGDVPAVIDNITLTELDKQYWIWTPVINLPSARYYGGSVASKYSLFTSGGDITGGGVATNQFIEYDIVRNTYSDMPPMQNAVRLNEMVKFDGKIISAGGFYNSAAEPTDEIQSFDLNTLSWSLSGALPKKLFYHRFGVNNFNTLYMAGGSDENDILSNEVYYQLRGSTTWNAATPIPGDGRADGGFAILDDNNIDKALYIAGFTNSFEFPVQIDSVFVGTIDPNDPSQITWESKSNFPGGPRGRVRAFQWGQHKVIVIGGATGQDFSSLFNDVWLYDVVEDKWTALDNFPMEICAYMGGSVQLTSKIWGAVIAGGVTTGPVLTNKTTVVFDTLDVVTSVGPVQNLNADSYYLFQNYPNPFNPSTTIQFALPKESFAKLEIFNAIGERVSTLVSETLAAGTYNYEWNAEWLSSGIYFYRLTAGNYIQTKKLLLMK